MAKNTLTLIITADGKKALDTINATDTSLRKLSSQTYELEKRIKAGNEVSVSMADAFRLMNDLVNRNVLAQKQLNPSINENEAALKAWGEMIKTVSTQGGALGSETLEYLKMQYASVAEQIQKSTEQITNESKPIEDTAKSVEEVSKATDSLAVNTKSASSYWSKLFDTTKNVLMFRVIMNVINSIAGLSNFLNDSVQAAAEAEQVFSKLNTVFGETSGAMAEVVSLASQIGVASSTAASALSTVGDLLQAQGQTTTKSLQTASEWVSQFQDIIAFKDINMSLEEFAQNFMSGAAGNLRNFRTFGSIVRESAVNAELAKKGLDKLTGSELELAKMTTRAEMALEQQKNAIGATQREWDSMLSVQRRYEEQMKMFRENVGESMSPVIKMWIELKTVMLEVFNAQKTWQEKIKLVEDKKAIDTKYYTFGEYGEIVNQSNYLGFENALDNANIMFGNGGEESQARAINSAILAMREYGASVAQVTQAFEKMRSTGRGVSSDFREAFFLAAEEYIGQLTEIEEKQKEADEAINKASFADSIFEQIQALENINFNGNEFYDKFINLLNKALSGEKFYSFNLNDLTDLAISQLPKSALKQIKDLQIEGPELVFSDDAELDRLEKIKEEYESLYAILYSGGDAYAKYLDDIELAWNDVNFQINKHNEEIEAQKKLLSDIESINSKTSDYEKQLRQIDMSETEKTLDDLNAMLEAATDEGLKSAIEAQIAAFNELTKATDERTRKEELEAKKKEIGEIAAGYTQTAVDYRRQARQLGLSEYEIAMQNYDEEFFRLRDEYNAAADELKDSIYDQIIAMFDERLAYMELTEATKAYNQQQATQQAWEDLGSQATGAFGEFGTFVTSLDSLGDVLGGGGGLLSILIDILAQTEVATRLSSLLTDSILPTLNAFLEPLLPVIDMLSEAIKSLVEIVLVPLFPILQGIASTLALVIGSVMTGLDLIANGVKKTIGYIVSGIENAVNWIIDMFNKIPGVNIGKVSFGPSNWADIDLQGVLEEDMAWIGDTLEKIAESNMEISDNTDPAKDFSTYQKLLAAKEIDEATYNIWTGMDKYTTQSLANGVSYAQGNRSYINVNNLTVQAPEGMTLVDFLKGIEDYNSGHSPYAVNTMAV